MITAGHCCYGNPPESFRVVAGDHDRYVEEGTEQVGDFGGFFLNLILKLISSILFLFSFQRRDVSRVTGHEDFSMSDLNDDICLLELSEPLEMNECLKRLKYIICIFILDFGKAQVFSE